MNDAFVGTGRLHRPLAPLVLPAVYDDVLSYEEWLSKVVARCNDLTELIETTMTNIEAEVNEMVDNRIDVHLNARLAPIQQQITQLQSDLTDAVANLNQKIDEDYNELDSKIDEKTVAIYQRITSDISTVNARITQVQNDLNQRIDNLGTESREYTDQKFLESQQEINRKIAELQIRWNTNFGELSARIDAIIKEYPRLYDPATGFKEDMQTLVYNLYKRLRYYGIEAMLYDDQELTAEEYDNECYSAIKYDTLLGRILFHDMKSMFNPFTGKYQSVRDVVGMLVRKLQWNGKTTEQYDGYEYTADEFDASTFDAYTQDTNQYYTGTTPDLKNKAYENYLLLTASLADGADVDIPVNAYYVRFEIGDKCYTIPTADVTLTIDSVGVSISSGVLSVTDGSLTNVFAVTPAKDVSELDK